MPNLTRRTALQTLAATGTLALLHPKILIAEPVSPPLTEFRYNQIHITALIQTAQRDNVTQILLGLDDDSLLQPFRVLAGKPAPGINLGGWYEYLPTYDFHHAEAGLAPGHALGQWISAMARLSAADPVHGPALAAKARRLTALIAANISPQFFANTRFPAYTLERFTCGMVDMHRILADPAAYPTLTRIVDAASPSLPGHAIDRDVQWKPGKDLSWMWDESFTLPENLHKAADDGAGPRFRQMANAYLLDPTYFEPLSRGENIMADRHAYSYVNALCSAIQTHLSTGSSMHRQAAINGFRFLEAQSFATGGWGPDELLRKAGYDELYKSLTNSHNSFETPCGSFAHAKLTRALLRVTRDGHYGDSMERVLFNTTMGARPLQSDGRSFYSSDYNTVAKRIDSVHRWPCCAGTLPQIVADYGINTYLHEPGTTKTPAALWINLYQNSELRWQDGTSDLTLTQDHAYPTDGTIRLRLSASRPTPLTLHLRIPAWTAAATSTIDPAAGTSTNANLDIRVNNQPAPLLIDKGFATLSRIWRTGDTVTLTLPMPLRLEALPANGGPAHLDTVALLHGPRVLFALREPAETGPLTLRRDALLAALQTAPDEWTVLTPTGPRRFVPFTALGDRTYTTYITAL